MSENEKEGAAVNNATNEVKEGLGTKAGRVIDKGCHWVWQHVKKGAIAFGSGALVGAATTFAVMNHTNKDNEQISMDNTNEPDVIDADTNVVADETSSVTMDDTAPTDDLNENN